MPTHDVVVVGASAGGLEALQKLVAGLPEDFQAALFIVLHIPPHSPSVLPRVLERAGRLPASHPLDGEEILAGHVYVAPPDHHLLVERGRVRTSRGPKENRFRPAVDPLFRSAAYAYGPRTVGVILTGALDDGAAGLWAVKDRGGVAVIQDPQEALFSSMPQSARAYVEIDYCLPLAEIAPLLVRLSSEPAAEERGAYPFLEELEVETRISMEDKAFEAGVFKLGEPSPYTCPECHGSLLQWKNGNLLRFRCHTGHAFSANSLLAELTESIEDTLWNTLRAVEESVLLMRHLAQHLRQANDVDTAERFLRKAQEAQQRTEFVRKAVLRHETLSQDTVGNEAKHL
jgi:two-component system, chemotaxis family, protein-glutamate methylesterase/glutaminase